MHGTPWHCSVYVPTDSSPDAKYCLYPECTMLTSSSLADGLVSTRNHFCGQEHWKAATQKGEVM